jgi:hypothetical protein
MDGFLPARCSVLRLLLRRNRGRILDIAVPDASADAPRAMINRAGTARVPPAA